MPNNKKKYIYEKSLQFIFTLDFLDKTNDKRIGIKKMKMAGGNWGFMIKLRWISFTIFNWDCVNEFARYIKENKED